jgi:L-amino acid N-acyltransferase YncA
MPPHPHGRALEIRPATSADAPTIFRLVRELAMYEGLRRHVRAALPRFRRHGFGRRPFFRTLICSRGRRPVGFALYFFSYSTFLARPTLYVEDIYVRPEQRGQGAGTALFSALARIAVVRGCGRMEWVVLRHNASGIRFYRSVGAEFRREWVLTRLTGAPLRRRAQRGAGRRRGRRRRTGA